MTTPCPACGETLSKSDRQNFCGTCGEPINREPDREFIRRNARGFLSRNVRKQLLDTVQGERDHKSEYTAIEVQEQARQALFDFSLIHKWDGIEDADLFFADVEAEPEFDPHEPGELMLQLIAIIRLLALVYANTSAGMMVLLEVMIAWEEEEVDADDGVDVQFLVDDEPIGEI